MIYYSSQLAGNRLFALPVTADPKPIEIMRSDVPILGARISPDGRLVAYQSADTPESLTQRIFVRTLDLAAGTTGDTATRFKGDASFGMGLGVGWRRDGRELYYLAPKHAVMAVDIGPAGVGSGNSTAPLQRSRRTHDAQSVVPWGGVSRDGQRVVYAVAPKGASPPADPISQLAVLDRQGKLLRRVGPPGRYGQAALSPDGTRIAVRWFDSFAPADDPTSGSWTSRRASPHRSPTMRRQTSIQCGRPTASRFSGSLRAQAATRGFTAKPRMARATRN